MSCINGLWENPGGLCICPAGVSPALQSHCDSVAELSNPSNPRWYIMNEPGPLPGQTKKEKITAWGWGRTPTVISLMGHWMPLVFHQVGWSKVQNWALIGSFLKTTQERWASASLILPWVAWHSFKPLLFLKGKWHVHHEGWLFLGWTEEALQRAPDHPETTLAKTMQSWSVEKPWFLWVLLILNNLHFYSMWRIWQCGKHSFQWTQPVNNL